jgi:catechol 2,3-dioxygenase-like lactoylglutathione lyase family enzyme
VFIFDHIEIQIKIFMITRMNHVSVFVLNQDSAYEFYVNKLGFKVNTDAGMGPGMRWLTVARLNSQTWRSR